MKNEVSNFGESVGSALEQAAIENIHPMDAILCLGGYCPSSNKWNRGSDYLVESFVPRYHVTRHAAGSANDVSRWSSS